MGPSVGNLVVVVVKASNSKICYGILVSNYAYINSECFAGTAYGRLLPFLVFFLLRMVRFALQLQPGLVCLLGRG
jgi:hypothetical protein